MKVTLIGMGPGAAALRTGQADQALRTADCLIGSEALLTEYLDESGVLARPAFSMTRAAQIADFLALNPQYRSPCVLLRGDTGFYSGAKSLLPLLRALPGCEVVCLPGVSSVQLLAARLEKPWQSWKLASAHGEAVNVAALVQNHAETCFLTGRVTPQGICEMLCRCGLGQVTVTVGQRLSYPDESICSGTAQQLRERDFAPLSVVLVENPVPLCPPQATQGLPDEAFCRGEVPMTKQEVRAVALAKLALREDDVVYDVGAGTGSVAVEAALQARFGRVYAIERFAAGCALIRENAARFGLCSLEVVEGTAPEALRELPAPDAVFIGGSGGHLEEIVQAVLEKNPQARLVISAVTLETLSAASALLGKLALPDTGIVQLSAARARQLGGSRLLLAQNPVFLLSAGGRQP